MRVRAEAKESGTLHVNSSASSPTPSKATPTALRQILINLVGNAIKFTETGSVRLVTRLLQDNRESPQLRIDVIDTGIGIAPGSTWKDCSSPSAKGDSSTSRRFGGTGLGLAISKRLAKMLGGDIAVASEPGQGQHVQPHGRHRPARVACRCLEERDRNLRQKATGSRGPRPNP